MGRVTTGAPSEQESGQGSAEAALARLGIDLPTPLPPFGEYVPAVRSGNRLWVGGHFGTRADGTVHTGKVGAVVSTDEARDAARAAAVNLLATVRAELGSLDSVTRVVHLSGVVNAEPHFTEHTRVIDAASEVFVAVFGDRGRHARLAVGVASLPGDLVLEIEAVIEIDGDAPISSGR